VSESITLDEVLAELSRLNSTTEEGPTGFTGRELAARIGMTTNTAQARLREMVYAGKVEFVGKRAELGIAGVRCHIPVYRLRKPQPQIALGRGEE
jgi:DNA-binding IclR family transcriptional regulator